MGKPFAQMKTTLEKFSRVFQILVLLDTISDWPWWVSWQHIYSQSLPSRNTGNTAWDFLVGMPHLTNIICKSFAVLTFKRTGAWGKSWSRQIYVFDLNLPLQGPTRHAFARWTLNQLFPQYDVKKFFCGEKSTGSSNSSCKILLYGWPQCPTIQRFL